MPGRLVCLFKNTSPQSAWHCRDVKLPFDGDDQPDGESEGVSV